MRLIDEDEIKKREHDVVLANGAKHRCFDTTTLFEIPTVNAVEVVRCKDCKYRNGDKDKPYCDRINPYRSFYVGDNDFCSWGEKNGNNY